MENSDIKGKNLMKMNYNCIAKIVVINYWLKNRVNKSINVIMCMSDFPDKFFVYDIIINVILALKMKMACYYY